MSIKKKKAIEIISLICSAGAAQPSPKLGQALGPKGVNMMEFCKKFNELTKSLEKNAPIPAKIFLYKDKSFDVTVKMPTLTYYIKKYTNIEKGSKVPGREQVGILSIEDCKKIANVKKVDFNTNDDDKAFKMVIGAAKSMGIDVN